MLKKTRKINMRLPWEKRMFDDVTSVTFKINQCKLGKKVPTQQSTILLHGFPLQKQSLSLILMGPISKDCSGKLSIRKVLLNALPPVTTATDSRLAAQLAYCAYSLSANDIEASNGNGESPFSLSEKREILAYITSVYNPLFDKYLGSANGWGVQTPVQNMAVEDQELLAAWKAANYYGIPNLKGIVAELDFPTR